LYIRSIFYLIIMIKTDWISHRRRISLRGWFKAGVFILLLSGIFVKPVYSQSADMTRGPIVELGQDTSCCSGDFVVFNAGPGFTSYHWSGGQTTQTITASVEGMYSVTVTTSTGDTASDSVYLHVIPPPSGFSLGPDTVICSGYTVFLDAGPDYSIYLWQDGSTTQTYTASDQGWYSVSVSGECGIASDSIYLTEIPLPIVSLGMNRQICTGDTLTLDPGSQWGSFQWNTGASSQTIRVFNTGVYSVTVTDTNSCINHVGVTVVVQTLPQVELGEGGDVCDITQTMLDAGSGAGVSTYLWQDGSHLQTFLMKDPGTYSVTVTNTCGSSSDSVTFVACPDCNLDLPNAFSPNGDGNNDILYPVGTGYISVELLIYNRDGQNVFTTKDLGAGWDGTFNGIAQPNEVYYYYLQGECMGGKVYKKKGDVTLIR
jgi:gliding motility-associated-like protein